MNNNLLREPQLDYSNLDPKLIGRYYTPLSVARSLVNWAVTRKDSRIFLSELWRLLVFRRQCH